MRTGSARRLAAMAAYNVVLETNVEETSRVVLSKPRGTDRLKANLELGRSDVKLLKKSVLSISS